MKRDNGILIRMLSERAGYDVATPHGAEKLQKDILSATGERLSVNTVKRLTGVLPYESEPRLSTLEILARYLGFGHLESLEAALKENISGFCLPENFIDASTLPPGAMLYLEWAPGRRVAMRHTEGEYYRVEAVENSKLRKGDLLTLGYVAEGYPLIAKDVMRGGINMGEYTAAAEGGLTKVALDE